MFDCQFCGKTFGDKAGLTQHCKGKKHRENMDTFEKRKEPDALETAAVAQRQKLESDAKIAMEAEALQQFQKRVEAERAARLQEQKISSDEAASLKKTRDSVSETRASSLSTSVRGGFADEVKFPKFYESFLNF